MIVNFRLTHVDSRVFMDPEEVRKYKNVNINYDINIRGGQVHTPEGAPGPVLRVEYALTINYLSPNVGHLRFEGSTDYHQPGQDPALLKARWDQGQPPAEVQNEIANTVLANLAPLAMTLSQRLGLPPSLPLPQVDFGKKQPEQQPKFTHYHG